MLKRYFIQLSYDGTDFHGWQIQPNAKTIQELLNSALTTVLRTEINVIGCGRTDTGVHARYFIAHFDTPGQIVLSVDDLVYKLNRILPPSIAIQAIFPVADEWHARFSATSRSYEYWITTLKDPFNRFRKWEFREQLDLEQMNAAARLLIGEQDFSCFSKSNTQTETNICTVTEAFWTRTENDLCFSVSANRFLRNMVRAIVGTLVEVGQGKLQVRDMESILASKNRSEAGTSVPAHGLYLTNVNYPDELKING